jgi:hypothetical protein
MTISHTMDVSAIPEVRALVDFIAQRMEMTPDEAAASQADFERSLREQTLSVERAVHAIDFARQDVDAPGIVVGGVRCRRRGQSVGHYTTLAGPIEVVRTIYRERGGHGGETIAALDRRLGLVGDHWTPVAAEVATTCVASVPTAEAAVLLRVAGTMTPSPSHLDRVTKHTGALWEAQRVELEDAVRSAERLDLPSPERVKVIALSLDGVMVPMKDAPRTPGLGKKDQGPKGHKEASCGTVLLYDEAGERLRTIRFGRMPEAYKRTLHQQLVAELQPLVEYYPAASVIAVADGVKENWRIISEVAAELGVEITERLDFFHAAEHLGDALRAAGMDADAVAEWCARMKNEKGVVEAIIEELGVLSAQYRRKAIRTNFDYFINNAGRIDYAEALESNQPIGSGVQEAACKTLVAERMKRSGMAWREPGGQAVLTFRSLAQSGRLHRAWEALRPTLPSGLEIDPNTARKSPARCAA